jgi:hypothetical protein
MTNKIDPKTETPTRTNDTRRPGKKSISWHEDPEILSRLAIVSQLMNKGKRAWEIAKETCVSLPTARLDVSRVKELWKAEALERISNSRDSALAHYGEVIGQAWKDALAVPARNSNRAAFLNIILRAQERVDKITGIADPISGPGGGPIPVELVDIEKIRKERWKAIKGTIRDIESKSRPKT